MTWRSRTIVEVDGVELPDVLGYTAARGNAELEGLTPGTATITLNNTSGDYDPGNTGSPYSGMLLPGKTVRIRERWNLLADAFDYVNGVTIGPIIGGTATAAVPTGRTIAGTGTIGFSTPEGLSGVPVIAGEPLFGGFTISRSTATTRNATASVRFWTAGGVLVSTATGTAVATSLSAQFVSVATTVPATAAFAALRVEVAAAAPADSHLVTALLIHPDAPVAGVLPGNGPDNVAQGGPLIDYVWSGVADSWLPVQSLPGTSTTVLRASGVFAQVGRGGVLSSWWSTAINAARVDRWYRLSDAQTGGVAVDSSPNAAHGRYRRAAGSTDITFTDGLIAGDDDQAVNLDAVWQQYVELPPIESVDDVSVVFWIKAPAAAAACSLVDLPQLQITLNASGQVVVTGPGLPTLTGLSDVRGNVRRCIRATLSSGDMALFVDGIQEDANSGTLTTLRADRRWYVGCTAALASFASFTFDEVVIQSGTVDSFTLWGLGTAGDVDAGQGVSDLGPIGLLFSLAARGLNPFDAFPGVAEIFNVGRADWRLNFGPAVPVLTWMETASQHDGNVWRESKSEGIFLTEIDYETPTGRGWVLGPGAGEIPYVGAPTVDYGEALIVNDVTISRPTSPTIHAIRQSSIDSYGRRGLSTTSWHLDDRKAREQAQAVVARYAEPGRRLTRVQIDTARADGMSLAMRVDIGDVVTVKDLTVDGRTVTTTARVLGVALAKQGNAVTSCSITLSPVRLQPLILDSDTRGVLGDSVSPPTGKLG